MKIADKNVKILQRLINEILDGETEGTFVRKTHLSANMFSRIRKQVGRSDPPQRNTLMSVAVGYNLDYQITTELFRSVGVKFMLDDRRDYAYQFLLTNCRGKSIDECNEILEALGIEKKYWLGAHAKKNI